MKAECVVCGKEFEKKGTAKTCDKKCSNTSHLERAARYREANRKTLREAANRYYKATRDSRRKPRREAAREAERRYREANREALAEASKRHKGIHRAAKLLGIPPALYAAMKIRESFQSQQPETQA